MYLVKNDCRFEHGGVSFRIPRDYYFVPEEPDYFCCIPLEEGFKVYYEFCWEDKGPKKALEEYQRETYETSAPIEKIEHNGLKGYCSTFGDVEDETFVAVFSVVDREGEFNRFKFSIRTKDFNIEKIKASAEFWKLYDGIWKTTRRKYTVKKNSK
ncbi:MAG: hypothetical protein HFE77_01315 [Clostridiales bacterium]|nr:hypothetical protein [Clostridiales bacterium]